MIRIDVPAYLQCVATDCTAKHPMELHLLADGGIGWKAPPDARGWQLVQTSEGPLLARCPLHVFTPAKLEATKEVTGRIRAPRDNGHH